MAEKGVIEAKLRKLLAEKISSATIDEAMFHNGNSHWAIRVRLNNDEEDRSKLGEVLSAARQKDKDLLSCSIQYARGGNDEHTPGVWDIVFCVA
jgi:hypothetical protein